MAEVGLGDEQGFFFFFFFSQGEKRFYGILGVLQWAISIIKNQENYAE